MNNVRLWNNVIRASIALHFLLVIGILAFNPEHLTWLNIFILIVVVGVFGGCCMCLIDEYEDE